jgi:FtsP/CotA-like multicopper oxidase with cupredoxin domain
MTRKILIAFWGVLAAGLVLAAPQSFDLALTGGKPPVEHETIRVAKGDEVTLRFTSDRAIALHLHGYDIQATVAPGGEATMRFTASIAGRFPVSEHTHGPGHHRAVLYLEVLP